MFPTKSVAGVYADLRIDWYMTGVEIFVSMRITMKLYIAKVNYIEIQTQKVHRNLLLMHIKM